MDSISKSIKLPKRSARFGVGKEIGGAVYVHKRYQHVFPDGFEEAKRALPPNFEYVVVKYDLSTDAVSFIQSDDFDSAAEPTVGDVNTIRPDGTCTFRRNSQIRGSTTTNGCSCLTTIPDSMLRDRSLVPSSGCSYPTSTSPESEGRASGSRM